MLVDINLLPQKERDRPAFLIAAIAILLLAVIVWAVFALVANANENEQQLLAAQSLQVTSEQEAIRAKLEAAQGMNEEQQLKVTVDWAESYQFDTVPLLEELVSILPARGFFESFSYTGLDQATLSVQFDTTRQAAYYLAQLKASELIKSVTLDGVAQKELNAEESGEVIDEVEEKLPRYIATYTILFDDQRLPTDDTAVPVDGEAATETPVEEVVPAEEVEVNVDVTTETESPETAPVETGGDEQ
ncbi:fimbrial assembly family protein [Planococcus donghaensis MPA1U2]|uniref:Fimbrial assembly family protein n=1 Tax=Planococcus donghaensis MPA1U2 TaxID=933115 RepID=E7RIJ3_9BACL|nr:PilN domain-containing protein [Planococcus donghaensis]EGA89099.1 fimbrial assembly family protein [Planococcus donghaensis MPA1U2]